MKPNEGARTASANPKQSNDAARPTEALRQKGRQMTPSSQLVGPIRVRPQIKNGAETGKWFVDVRASLTTSGQRKRKLFDNQDMAMSAAKALQQRIDPVTGMVVTRPKKNRLTIEAAIAGWADHERQRVMTLKKRAATLKNDLYKLTAVARYFAGRTLASITEADLVKYQAHRLRERRKPITVNDELNILYLVFAWAVKHKRLTGAPKCERVPEPPIKSIVPTREEVLRIISALPPKYRLIVRFLAETGCRKGEARNLTWDCLDLDGGFAEIESRAGWTPKTQASERSILLSAPLLAELRRLVRQGRYVFPGATANRPMGEFRKPWNKAVADARIMRRGKQVHIPVKSLRKAHATWQVERGLPESVLQDRMGHASGSKITRKFYVQVTDEAKRAAVIELPASLDPTTA